MMKPTVRFGRVPKREKAKILAAMQSVNAKSQEKALTLELEDEAKLVANIVKAYLDTCDYTKDKIYSVLQTARANPIYTQCSSAMMACPLNPSTHNPNGNHMVEDFSQRFSPVIQGVVEFAKRIPGFSLLSQDDQVTLLKAGVFEVLLVRLACMFDGRSNTMVCLNGHILKREMFTHSSNARFLMDSMFDFAERLNTMQLQDPELGLFCAVVIIASDRPGIRNVELVEKMQSKMMQALQNIISQNHLQQPNMFQELMKKIPDLRTLNTLHSEKLLAFKMDSHMVNSQAASTITSAAANSTTTSLNSIYQAHSNHWSNNCYNGGSEDSKGSWGEETDALSPPQSQQQQNPVQNQRILSSHDIHHHHHHHGVVIHNGSDSVWNQSADNCKNQDIYASNLRSPDGGSGSSYRLDHLKSPLGSSSSSTKSNSPMMIHKDHEGGNSSGDDDSAAGSPANGKCPYKNRRKLDSPTDSGIDSGKELGNCGSGASTSSGSHSRSTSICSSPRSSMEEKVKDISDCEMSLKQESIEDMPVLKRALQAPPLINHNEMMNEAYKPHKKFRALRKDSDSNSGASIDAPVMSPVSMAQSPLSLASTHSTLVKTLSQGPRITEQQQKRSEILHNFIMNKGFQQDSSNAMYSSSSPNHLQSTPSPFPSTSPPAKTPVMLCPPSYYAPAQQNHLVSGSNTNSSSNWSAQPYHGARTTSPYNNGSIVSSSHNQNFNTTNQNSTSPVPRLYYQNGSAPILTATSPQSPTTSTITHVVKSPTSPPAGQTIVESLQQNERVIDRTDSQPLNLSKKLPSSSNILLHHLKPQPQETRPISPQRVKMEVV